MSNRVRKTLDVEHRPGDPPHRLTRTRKLTAQEVARQREIRQKVMAEFPPTPGSPAAQALKLREFLAQLREERERLGISLGTVAKRSGIDKATLSRLETGRQPNPTLGTILRYAESIGKAILWQFVDISARDRGRLRVTKR